MTTHIVYEASKTTHWKNLFPNKSQLLGSHNLNTGEELVATIVGVSVEEIKDQNGKAERVPVLKFEKAPPMVLNITNTRTIASLYGERYDQWQGRSIQLFSTTVKAFGEEMTALRVRPVIPSNDIDTTSHEARLRACTTMEDLKKVFMGLPNNIKVSLTAVKDEVKEAINASN